jgi:hypothetical protein
MAGSRLARSVLPVAAVFNLNHHVSYVQWHFITLSLSNVLVIAVMFVVFFAAIFAPFPRRRGNRAP